jgi:hypothetical protein
MNAKKYSALLFCLVLAHISLGAYGGFNEIVTIGASNGKYVTRISGDVCMPSATTLTKDCRFYREWQVDGTIALRSITNRKYLSADLSRAISGELIANKTTVGTTEKFTQETVAGGTALKASANAKYVTIESAAGDVTLRADRTTPSTLETFIIEIDTSMIELWVDSVLATMDVYEKCGQML